MPVRVPVARHNEVLQAAYGRIDVLEERLAEILQPILEQAGARAASQFNRKVTNHMTAAALRQADRDALARIPPGSVDGAFFGFRLRPLSVTASAPTPSSAMVCLKPRPDEAARIAQPGGEAPEDIHVTLVVLGEVAGGLQETADALAAVAATHSPLEGVVGGYGRFVPADVNVLLPDVPGLVELRVAVTEALVDADIGYARDHGFEAHITIDHEPDPENLAEALMRVPSKPLHFDSILIVQGDETIFDLPLIGPPPLTAAGDPPDWTAPAGDEILNIDDLISKLRTKTDPVRLAMLKSVMAPVLGDANIAFDVTNPLTKKVLSQAGSQITSIAQTTQLNVMRIIDRAYNEGLSIPDTAKAIRAGMSSASGYRARMIARTELAGAANGGSLAATQLAEKALGVPYFKQWLTAPGAPHPRHELYEGLDGQTRPLSEPFDVGGNSIQFPGDPDGAPEDTINCFPGSTLVQAPGLEKGFRRRYEGDLVRLEVLDVGYLAATPNHPVLTSAGWKPIGLVREGDYLIHAHAVQTEAAIDPDVDHAPAAIHEVFGALARAKVTSRVRGGAVQFHGDPSADGEVEVVAADGDLRSGLDTARTQEHGESGLVRAGLAARGLAGDGFALHLGVPGDPAAASLVGGRGEPLPVGSAGLPHPDDHRLGTAARHETDVPQRSLDHATSDAVALAEGEYGDSFLVSLAKVVGVERSMFRGDVFNLQTESGTFVANGIIVHNCRCALAYTETPPDAEALGEPGAGIDATGTSTEGQSALEDATPDAPPPGDTVSVDVAPFVEPSLVARIKREGFDVPLKDLRPTTDVGREIFAKAPSTELLHDGGDVWTDARKDDWKNWMGHFLGGHESPAAGEQRYFVHTAGGSGSGKGGTTITMGDRTFTVGELEDDLKLPFEERKFKDIVLVNADLFKELIPEFQSLKNVGDIYAASGVHEESSILAKKLESLAHKEGYNIVFDGTGASHSMIDRLDLYAKDGYKVDVRMTSIPTNEAIKRAMYRGDKKGRYVAMQAIKDAHRGASKMLDIWKDSPSIDSWKLYDNTDSRILVAEGGKNVPTIIHDEAKWEEILAKQNERSAAPGVIVSPKAVTEMASDLTPSEVGAIRSYTGVAGLSSDSYVETNRFLRGLWKPRGANRARIEANIREIDIAIERAVPLDHEVVLYRGIPTPAPLGELHPGMVIQDKAFVSTSTTRALPESWAGTHGDVWEITVPAGTKALDLSRLGLSAGHENEVLLGRDTKIVVDTVKERVTEYPNGNRVVAHDVTAHVELIQAAPVDTRTVASIIPGPSARDAEETAFAQDAMFSGWRQYANTMGLSSDTLIADIERNLAEKVKDAPVDVRVHLQNLPKIIADGRFKSQFETNTTGGTLNPNMRRDAERTLFGYQWDLPDAERPIYGYLGGSEHSTVNNYGDVIVRMKDEVRARTTFTMTDSLGPADLKEIAAVPVDAPSARAFNAAARIRSQPPSATGTLRQMSDHYAEAQIHGGVTTDDIAEVLFDRYTLAEETNEIDATMRYYENKITDLQRVIDEAVRGQNVEGEKKYLRESEGFLAAAREQHALVENDGAKLRAMLDEAGIPSRVIDFTKM